MIESGHFRELQSIVDMLPIHRSTESQPQNTQNCMTVSSLQRKKRQTFVFSATLALSADFRKKLKRGSMNSKKNDGLNSFETLSERAGMRPNTAIIDLTNASILVNKLEESVIEYVFSLFGVFVLFPKWLAYATKLFSSNIFGIGGLLSIARFWQDLCYLSIHRGKHVPACLHISCVHFIDLNQ